MKNFFRWSCILSILFIIFNIAVFPTQTAQSVKRSMWLCANHVIPSLFPFFVCSSLFLMLGGARIFSCLRLMMRFLFNISENGTVVFIIGLIGGCPASIKAILGLYESGGCSREEAQRLLAFCNNVSPIFVLGTAAGILNNSINGWVLYLSQITSALIVGIIFKFWPNSNEPNHNSYGVIRSLTLTQAVSESISSSALSLLNICGFVVFFSVFSDIFSQLFPDQLIRAIFCGIVEVTNGVNSIAKINLDPRVQMSLISAVISSCGISIMFQSAAIISGTNLSISTYIIGKIMQSTLSFIFTYTVCQFLNLEITAFAPYTMQNLTTVNILQILLGFFFMAIWLVTAGFILKLLRKSKSTSSGLKNWCPVLKKNKNL